VLIVDDHRCFADLLSAALASVPGVRCVGTATSANEGIEKVQELSPSVVVMDIQMPGTDGLEATRRLREASPGTAVAVVTAHDDSEWVARAARAGASAFIPKNGSLTEMISLLRSAEPGAMSVAASVPLPHSRAKGELESDLTPRELEVLRHVAQGLQSKEIAEAMGVSIHTCRSYLKAIYHKLGVTSRIGAVNRGRQLQLLDT